MAEQIVYQLKGNYQGTPITLNAGQDGGLYHESGQPAGSWSYPGSGNFYQIAFNDGSTATYDFNAGMIYGQDYTLGMTLNEVVPTAPTQPTQDDSKTPDFSANTQMGTFTYGDTTYQMVSDGSPTIQLWAGGRQAGYATPGSEGFYNVYTMADEPSCTVNLQTGAVMGADGSPLGTISAFNGQPFSGGGIDTSQYKGTVTLTNPDGTASTYYMTYTGQIVDAEGKPFLTYSQTGDYDYTLTHLDGTAYGTYNTQTGTVNLASGETFQGGFTPTDVSIPPYGDITSASEGSRAETLTTDKTGRTDTSMGIDWGSPVASALLPSITESALALPGLAKTAGTQAQEGYLNLMNQAMGPQNFQGYLNALASRGILDSSLTGSTLANVQQQTAQAVASKAFEADLANTLAQMKVPGYLGALTSQLGGTTGTTTIGETGTATTAGTQAEKKTIQDPLRPYSLRLRVGV